MTQFCVTSTASVGCTFLDWSVHFLSGQTEFYNINTNSWIELSRNPVTKTNAHGHKKNHPLGQENFKKYVDHIESLDDSRIYSTYPAPMLTSTAMSNLDITVDQVSSNHSVIQQYIISDYNQILNTCYSHHIPLVIVGSDPRVDMYFLNRRSMDRWTFDSRPGKPGSQEDSDQEYQEILYSKSTQHWKELGLENVWDHRERYALDMRLNNQTKTEQLDLQHPHLWIYCQDLWTNGEVVLKKIMNYLALPIAADRLTDWKEIYSQWQKIQIAHMEFEYNRQHIVDSIVNNWFYEIDLTFKQEAIIQHLLIYKHNLNLKTWGLTKFPRNTQDLYKLLEPNIHTLTPY